MSSVRTLTRRTNNASAAYFTDEAMEKPFQKGGLRYVAKGVYTDGPRRGQTCVCKWPKSGFVDSASPYEDDMRVVSKASEIIEKFNEAKIIDKIVVMNRPETWTLSGDEWDGKVVMLEPYISNYTKFNSNSGWGDSSSMWGKVMQALSHFSYHITEGNYLLCDLQGGVYRRTIVLTDPVILSRHRGGYGATDLGYAGILAFFNRHQCNCFCMSEWRKPLNPLKCVLRPQRGTMKLPKHVETHKNRPKATLCDVNR